MAVKLLSVKDACDLLGVGRTTLYQLRKRGLIRSVRIGRRVLFDLRDLEIFVEKSKQKAADVA